MANPARNAYSYTPLPEVVQLHAENPQQRVHFYAVVTTCSTPKATQGTGGTKCSSRFTHSAACAVRQIQQGTG